MIPLFAGLEDDIDEAVAGAFANVNLYRRAQDKSFEAILDRHVEELGLAPVGEAHRRLTMRLADVPGLERGEILEYDPQYYSPDELDALQEVAFRVDVVEPPAGNLIRVWVTSIR